MTDTSAVARNLDSLTRNGILGTDATDLGIIPLPLTCAAGVRHTHAADEKPTLPTKQIPADDFTANEKPEEKVVYAKYEYCALPVYHRSYERLAD